MGNSNFFAKLASIDPIAQMAHLPGAHKYVQQQARDEAGKAGASGGAYTGVDPTLAGANAGYVPRGPGATQGWSQYQPRGSGGLFGQLQKGANFFGNTAPSVDNSGKPIPGNLSSGDNQYVQPNVVRNPVAMPNPYGVQNPWVTAARGATTQQNPQWGTQ